MEGADLVNIWSAGALWFGNIAGWEGDRSGRIWSDCLRKEDEHCLSWWIHLSIEVCISGRVYDVSLPAANVGAPDSIL